MKLASMILVTCLLLATASFAVATDNPAPSPEVTAPSQTFTQVLPAQTAPPAELTAPVADEPRVAPAAECADDAEPLVATGWEKQTLASEICGSCSVAICVGSSLGSNCGGTKHCNTFTGAVFCAPAIPGSGFRCQCRSGPIP